MPSSALVHPVRRKRPQEAVFAYEADEVRGRPGTALNARPTGKICTCTSCASEADRRARGKEDTVRTRKRSSNRCSWRDEPGAVPDVALMPVGKATVRERKSPAIMSQIISTAEVSPQRCDRTEPNFKTNLRQ